MTEQHYPAGPAMVKIDGTKVRAIREQKGLTQLYVATVVEVTTDTVSRWENKRYPTIKKENGLRLAEALEVELSEILDAAAGVASTENDASESADQTHPSQDGNSAEGIFATDPWYHRPGHLSIFIVIAALVGGVWAALHYLSPEASISETTVTRVVSPHFIPGKPLPVFLKIANPSPEAVSIILKEEVPDDSTFTAAFPSSSGIIAGTVKWLTKVTGSELFYYTITTDPSFNGTLSFSGSVQGSNGSQPAEILGDVSTRTSLHHWADIDGDNRISDEEILRVYDLVANETPSALDLDLLEEMWLGEGYQWQPEQRQFFILP
ncbi:MAG: helix-turn-helix domain-containing protein [Desulfofustis sp.]|nr:helix-turn-helix domain-containing protein [Desulfofustis sp.]